MNDVYKQMHGMKWSCIVVVDTLKSAVMYS